jgi:hypothetical protein
MLVYVLQHTHVRVDGEEDLKLIGVYSSMQTGRAAVEKLSKQPGFSATSSGFTLEPYTLDETSWQEGFVTLTKDDFPELR